MRVKKIVSPCLALSMVLGLPATAGPGQDAVLARYKALAVKADPAFKGFSSSRGREFFSTNHRGGNPETPSCTSCHTSSPLAAGRTRAGKSIDPMAVSRTPDRFTDFAKTEKWFGRNCKTVLGRDCSAAEKGDFITYLSGI